MKNVLCLACAFLSLATLLTADEKAYDFHSSAAYKKLPAADKQRLEKVRRDQVLLWGRWTCMPRITAEICLRHWTNSFPGI